MHWARRAPELSATVNIVRSWIMMCSRGAGLGLARALHEFEETPTLVLRQGARLHEADHVALLAHVALVVDLELLAPPHVAADRRMLDEAHDLHDDRLGHLVRDHASDAGLPPRAVGSGQIRFGHRAFSLAGAFAA